MWLYHRFSLSLHDVEEPMLERGVESSPASIRQRMRRFGPVYAAALHRHRPAPGGN